MELAPLSYSLVIMLKDKIYGVRDPYGNRPLCIGKVVPVDSGYSMCDHFHKQSTASTSFNCVY